MSSPLVSRQRGLMIAALTAVVSGVLSAGRGSAEPNPAGVIAIGVGALVVTGRRSARE